MKFSIVIPNYNSTVIHLTLASLKAQDYDRDQFEVIVVGVDDLNLIQSDSLIFFDHTKTRCTPAEGRNRGARQARGEIIVFLDADCIAPTQWLRIIEQSFREMNADCVGGGVNFKPTNYWSLADNFSIFHEFLHNNPPGWYKQLPSLNMAVLKSAFFSSGGFDENYPLPSGEDFDFTYRLSTSGYRLYFEPNAWIWHAPPRNTFRDLLNHSYKMGLYSTKVNPKYNVRIGLPELMRNKWFLILLSPLLAAVVTLRMFIHHKLDVRFYIAFPAIYLSKIAWCFGAANSPFLRKSNVTS